MDKLHWESPEKNNLLKEPYLAVYDRDGYYYVQRAGTHSIAFILYREGSFGLLRCRHGVTQHVANRSFTGSLDVAWGEVVQQEVKEEAGYTVTNDRIYHVGLYEVGTQTNEHVHLFLVDVTGLEAKELELDGREAHDIIGTVWDPEKVEDWKAELIINWMTENVEQIEEKRDDPEQA